MDLAGSGRSNHFADFLGASSTVIAGLATVPATQTDSPHFLFTNNNIDTNTGTLNLNNASFAFSSQPPLLFDQAPIQFSVVMTDSAAKS